MERKTPSDMAGCIGASRERFEKELRRGRYVCRMIVVIEGIIEHVCTSRANISHNAIMGTLAAWTLRYCPFAFCWLSARGSQLCFQISCYPAA